MFRQAYSLLRTAGKLLCRRVMRALEWMRANRGLWRVSLFVVVHRRIHPEGATATVPIQVEAHLDPFFGYG